VKLAKKFGLFISGITSAFVSTAVINSTYVPPAQAANLVYNGDFEIDPLVDPNDTTGALTNPNITGWTKSGAIPSDAWLTRISNSSKNGFQSVEFGGFQELTFISQNIPTIAGQEYELSYYFANNDQVPDGENNNEFQTLVGGNLVSDLINTPFTNFVKYDFKFAATSPSTELKFGAVNRQGFLYLDNVIVTPVPESSTIGGIAVTALLGIWLKKKRLAGNLKLTK
jgi:hypothetical protein